MFIFYMMFFSFLIGAGWFLLPFALRHLDARRLQRYCREQGAVVLSYDDGPSQKLLPRILELLAEHDVPASFFLLGRNVETQNGAVALLQEAGHEIGSHTFHHGNAWKTWPWRSARDLAAGLRGLRDHGVRVELFRPPYGKSTLVTLLDCHMRGLRLGWWTIDSRDVGDRRPIDEILRALKAHGGGVVLMHDLDLKEEAGSDFSHAEYVIELTRDIIMFCASNGLRLSRMRDVYAKASEI